MKHDNRNNWSIKNYINIKLILQQTITNLHNVPVNSNKVAINS